MATYLDDLTTDDADTMPAMEPARPAERAKPPAKAPGEAFSTNPGEVDVRAVPKGAEKGAEKGAGASGQRGTSLVARQRSLGQGDVQAFTEYETGLSDARRQRTPAEWERYRLRQESEARKAQWRQADDAHKARAALGKRVLESLTESVNEGIKAADAKRHPFKAEHWNALAGNDPDFKVGDEDRGAFEDFVGMMESGKGYTGGRRYGDGARELKPMEDLGLVTFNERGEKVVDWGKVTSQAQLDRLKEAVSDDRKYQGRMAYEQRKRDRSAAADARKYLTERFGEGAASGFDRYSDRQLARIAAMDRVRRASQAVGKGDYTDLAKLVGSGKLDVLRKAGFTGEEIQKKIREIAESVAGDSQDSVVMALQRGLTAKSPDGRRVNPVMAEMARIEAEYQKDRQGIRGRAERRRAEREALNAEEAASRRRELEAWYRDNRLDPESTAEDKARRDALMEDLNGAFADEGDAGTRVRADETPPDDRPDRLGVPTRGDADAVTSPDAPPVTADEDIDAAVQDLERGHFESLPPEEQEALASEFADYMRRARERPQHREAQEVARRGYAAREAIDRAFDETARRMQRHASASGDAPGRKAEPRAPTREKRLQRLPQDEARMRTLDWMDAAGFDVSGGPFIRAAPRRRAW